MQAPTTFTIVAALALVGLSSPAFAQEDEAPPESIRGIKVVVPAARGPRKYGGRALTRSLRRTLTGALGPLVSSRKLKAAQRKLGLRGKRADCPKNLAKAARRTDAQYVLRVKITRKKWLYTARALLVNVETGEVQMDFRSGYYKPDSEPADRGRRIGRRTILKLEELVEAGAVPFAAEPPEPDTTDVPDEGARDPVAVVTPGQATPETGGATDLPPGESPSPDSASEGNGGDPTTSTPAPPPSETQPTTVEPPPSETVVAMNTGSTSPQPPPPPSGTIAGSETERPEPPAEDGDVEVLRFSVGGGSGLLRTYDVSSAGGAASQLSHRLKPLSVVTGRIDLFIPGLPVGLMLRSAYRPVRYTVQIDQEEPQQPSGMLLDNTAAIAFPLTVAGSGREAVRLVPSLGAHLRVSRVADHPASIIIPSTSIAPVGGLALFLPVNDVVEIDVGVDGGIVVSYTEDKGKTGEPNGGFTIGGDLALRVWLSSLVGIAFDTRFAFESLGFSGQPTRQVPSDEPNLTDVDLTTKDLITSVGVALRI